MVDNVNPVSNFHPYQPVSDVPAAERLPVGWKGLLQKLRSMDVRGWVRSKPLLLVGGIAALAIGAGVVRRLRA